MPVAPEDRQQKHSTTRSVNSKPGTLSGTRPSAIAEFSLWKLSVAEGAKENVPSAAKGTRLDFTRPLRMVSVAGPPGPLPILVVTVQPGWNRIKTWWSAFRKGSMWIIVRTVSEIFTKTVYRILAPLGFLIFVTDKRFLSWAPLDDFRKDRISKSDAIIFSAVCNKKGISKMRAIKWLLQSINFSDLCH